MPTPETALANRQTVRELVAVYERARARIFAAFAEIDAAELDLTRAFGKRTVADDDYRVISVQGKYNNRAPQWSKPEATMEAIDREVWKCLTDKLEIKRMMSIAAAKELDEQLQKNELPPVSLESIEAMARGFQQQAPTFLEDSIREVFEFLRPHNGRYKRNSQFEIPKRVVLEFMVEQSWQGWRTQCHQHSGDRDQRLVALENVLNSLDGNGSVCKTHHSDIYNALSEQGQFGATALFRYRAFQNGNLHLDWLRLDLLARLNQIAGGIRLKGERKAG